MKTERLVTSLILLGVMVAIIGCSGIGGQSSPTRTPRAVSEATQTAIVVYVPVTTTPEPSTATPLPTVTRSGPTVTNTRPPQPTAAPVTRQPTATPTNTPLPGPTNTPVSACGQAYQVLKLTFPENNTLRSAKPGTGQGATIQFMWDPVVSYQLDPGIGYRVNIFEGSQQRNALYTSHNDYLTRKQVVLTQQATYALTNNGDDVTITWNVDVIKTNGNFVTGGDDATPPTGQVVSCGPSSPTFSINLHVG